MKPATPLGATSSTEPGGVPMLPQLPSPGHLSLQATSLSGAGGNTLCSASLMHQGSGLAHQGSFSSQQQMHAMMQVRMCTCARPAMWTLTRGGWAIVRMPCACERHCSCLCMHWLLSYPLWIAGVPSAASCSTQTAAVHIQMQQPSTVVSHQETHVYTHSSETLKAHANVLKVRAGFRRPESRLGTPMTPRRLHDVSSFESILRTRLE